jgi:hypothetical protein
MVKRVKEEADNVAKAKADNVAQDKRWERQRNGEKKAEQAQLAEAEAMQADVQPGAKHGAQGGKGGKGGKGGNGGKGGKGGKNKEAKTVDELLRESAQAEEAKEAELGPAELLLKEQKERGNVFSRNAKSRLQQQQERETEQKAEKARALAEMRSRLSDQKSAKEL